MFIAVLEVRVEVNLVGCVFRVEMVASGAGAKGIGARVETGHGDGALVASEEGDEVARLVPVKGNVLTDFILIGNETS
jgi:hypothetical protein